MSASALIERFSVHTEREVSISHIESKQDFKILSSKLEQIQIVLEDAEARGFTNVIVENWLKQVEDITHEMDNVLDECEFANLPPEVQACPFQKVRSFVFSPCLCFKHVLGCREITKRLKALDGRIDNIFKERDQFFASVINNPSREFKQVESTYFKQIVLNGVFRQQESGSFVHEWWVCGRDFDKDNLVKQLLSGRGESFEDTQILSIVGMGGVGKTILAKLVYNDHQVENNFELKAWVSVAKPFDAFTVGIQILESFGKSSAGFHQLDPLYRALKNVVKKKKFLLVLDNVWTEERMNWNSLRICLRGAPGSRILVTTRSELVGRMMDIVHSQYLGPLSDHDCGTILNKIALHRRSSEDCEELGVIGNEIAKNCNGLPFAARSVGSMLALKQTKEEWRRVLESSLWKYGDSESKLFRLLKLSYIELSPILKRCFLSCVVFPKGSIISIDKLIRVWMAYGYLSSRDSADNVLFKGSRYFEHLATRSFFYSEHDGDNIQYRMHDIMYEFAIYVAGREYSWIIDGGEEDGRSLSFQRTLYNMPLNSLEKLRTFSVRYVSQEELPLNCLGHLDSVRLLSIIRCGLQKLPEPVGNLIHLRNLDLSHNLIQELPETVTSLYNLQTLGLENCYNLSKLPEKIDKLINLKHLLNSGTFKLVQFPKGLEKLTGLWTLSEFRVKEASEMGYLRNFDQLRGSLCINFGWERQTATTLEEVRKANLRNKNHLRELELFCSEEVTNDIVDALQPPPNLEILATRGIWGNCFSNWIETSFNKLKVISFDGLSICSDLPLFRKLPALEKLTIRRVNFKFLVTEFLGILKGGVEDAQGQSTKALVWFPRLKRLHFEQCNSWEEWEDISEEARDSVVIMPRLKELKIHDCNTLKSLPHIFLHQAASLQILEFESCDCLEDRYSEGLGPDWDKISHIPHVKFVDRFELPGQ